MTLWTFWGFNLSSAAAPAPPPTHRQHQALLRRGGFGLNNIWDGGTLVALCFVEDVFTLTHDQKECVDCQDAGERPTIVTDYHVFVS